MNYNVLGYGIYFFVILIVILYVGSALFRNGRPFCVNSFRGDAGMADATNRILLSGYYLINIGYSFFVLIVKEDIPDVKRLMEVTGFKIGIIVLILGIMHILNLGILFIIGKIKSKKSIHNNNQNLKPWTTQ